MSNEEFKKALAQWEQERADALANAKK